MLAYRVILVTTREPAGFRVGDFGDATDAPNDITYLRYQDAGYEVAWQGDFVGGGVIIGINEREVAVTVLEDYKRYWGSYTDVWQCTVDDGETVETFYMVVRFAGYCTRLGSTVFHLTNPIR